MDTVRITHHRHKYKYNSKLILNIVLAIAFFVFSFLSFYRNQGLVKAFLTGCVREAMKINMEIKTKDWKAVAGQNFTVKYEAAEDEKIAALVLDTAEQSFEEVNRYLKYEPNKKTLIVVYPDKASLNNSFGWDADEDAMGVYWAGVIRIVSPQDWVKDNENLVHEFKKNGPVVHEYAHLLVDYKTRGNYTRWFTEGVAQYIERKVTGFVFPKVKLKSEAEFYNFVDMDAQFDNLPNQQLAYSESLAAIDYLLEIYGEEVLESLMKDLALGKSTENAFEDVLGKDFSAFQKDFKGKFIQENLIK